MSVVLKDIDVKSINLAKIKYLMGQAGSITIHNCRTVHSSPPSKSKYPRPLLLNCYSSTDAKPYTANPQKSINRRNLLDYTDISDVIGSQEYKDYSRKLQSRVNDMGYTSYQDIPENIFNSSNGLSLICFKKLFINRL